MYVKGKEILKKNPYIAVPPIVVSIITGFSSYHIGKATPSAMFMPNPTLISTLFLFTLISMALSLLAEGASIAMSYEALKTEKTSLGSGITKVIQRLGSLIVAAILMSLVIGIGFFFFIIPGFIAIFFLIFTVAIVVIEDASPIEAMMKSYRVVRINMGNTFIYVGIAVFIILIGGIIGKIFETIPLIGKLVLSPALSGAIMAYLYAVLTVFYREISISI